MASNVQLKTLLQENRKVKNDSFISKTKMMAQDLKLRTVNHSVSTLYKRLSVILKDSEEKKNLLTKRTVFLMMSKQKYGICL